jgi:CrcB protein
MELLLVGIGGFLGSIARFQIGKIISKKSSITFPIATFLVNITGAFFLGIVSKLSNDSNIYLFLADGFLGAYTTFSSFMYEGFNLFKSKTYLNAIVYIFASLFFGIIAFGIGYSHLF